MTPRKLALWITETLFTNRANQRAARLVLELPGKRDGGGWSFQGAADKIESILRIAERSSGRGGQ